MKPMRILLLVLTTTTLAATAALAQPRMGGVDGERGRPARPREGMGERDVRRDRRPAERPRSDRRRDRDMAPGEAPPPRLEEVLNQLELTERQREQIGQILRTAREEGRAARMDAAAERREAMDALREARRSGDEEAAEQARQRLQALREGPRETLQDVRKQIEEVLSPQQREKLDRLMGPGGRFDAFGEALKAIDLRPVQKRQIREITAEANAKAKTQTDPRDQGRTYQQVREKIMDLLTDEQKDQLRREIALQQRRRQVQAMFAGLDLTAEQRQAVEKIQDEVREQVEGAETPQAQRRALREGQRRIITEVLTDQQRQQLREEMARGFGPDERPDRPDDRPDRGPRDDDRGRRDDRRNRRDGDRPRPRQDEADE